MELIKTSLKRVRESKSIEQKTQREADILWQIRGMVSVWSDIAGINKEAYAVEVLDRIIEMNEEFKEDEKLRGYK